MTRGFRLRRRASEKLQGARSLLRVAPAEHGEPSLRALRPPWWLLAVPLCLIAGYLTAATTMVRGAAAVANLVGPAALAAAAAAAGVRLVRREPRAVWTPYLWFLAAIVAFYGVGPLLHVLAGPETRRLASNLYRVTPQELLRTNLLNSMGILGILVGVRLVTSFRVRWFGSRARRGGRSLHDGPRGGRPARARPSARRSPDVGPEVAAATRSGFGKALWRVAATKAGGPGK